jgi:putative transcriptional regulator
MSDQPDNLTERPRLFERLAAGLDEGVAWARGNQNLPVTTVTIPDPPPLYDARRVRALRERLHISQQGFSRLLNVSPRTVQRWEQGTRLPSQASLRLLQVIDHPEILASVSSQHRTQGASGTK